MAKIEFGIKECAKCEYNLRCNECIYNKKDISKLIANGKAEVAREIFEEIEKEIELALESNYRAKAERLAKPNVDMADEFISYCDGKIAALRGIEGFAEELKKKYTEEHV